ncbi:hypothetical protein EC501_00015 [Lysinibacillus halotolerans]|uniref:Uncharacterized protein n=1 Tax=Lysinibacillus halotolerans TaxID=1368476 RepID=A0A3M8HGS9_9BACI|nr:hypothetical protein EC501_00015 [Lysinibacillus halotolerans]
MNVKARIYEQFVKRHSPKLRSNCLKLSFTYLFAIIIKGIKAFYKFIDRKSRWLLKCNIIKVNY